MNIKGKLLFLFLLANGAFAGTTFGTGGIPQLETPMQRLASSLSGPVAASICVIGLMVIGGMLMFGRDLHAFGSHIVLGVLAGAVCVTGGGLILSLFGVAGALV